MRMWFSHPSPVQLLAVTLDLLVPARFGLISLLRLLGSQLFLPYYVTWLNITGI